jgi:hypothetical protein
VKSGAAKEADEIICLLILARTPSTCGVQRSDIIIEPFTFKTLSLGNYDEIIPQALCLSSGYTVYAMDVVNGFTSFPLRF